MNFVRGWIANPSLRPSRTIQGLLIHNFYTNPQPVFSKPTIIEQMLVSYSDSMSESSSDTSADKKFKTKVLKSRLESRLLILES